MDWDLCKTFVAVAETRSFAAAARQLRSSHPTVGRKIAVLEDQLGIPLFARSNEGLAQVPVHWRPALCSLLNIHLFNIEHEQPPRPAL